MALDQMNQAIASTGGTWLRLRSTDDPPIDGLLVDFEQRGKTYEGAPVLSRKSGQQRTEWVVTLRCDPDPSIENDDGLRKFSANESMQRAISKALKEAGGEAKIDGRLQVTVTGNAKSSTEQSEYAAKYTPPALPIPAEDPFG